MTACREEGREPFAAVALTAGPGPLGVDEPMVVRFNRALWPESPSRWALSVKDDGGAVVPVRVEADGRLLVLWPRAGAWPRNAASLALTIPFPAPSMPIRSIDDEMLSRGFSARVALGTVAVAAPGALRLVQSDPPDGAREIDLLPGGSRRPQLVLAFDGAIEPKTLDVGLQIVDADRREVLDDVVKTVDPGDATRVLVEPFARGVLFDGGTRFEIRLTDALAAKDGRRLLRPQAIAFTTRASANRARIVRIGVGRPLDLDSRSRSSADLSGGVLRPRDLYQPLMPAITEPRLRAMLDGQTARIHHPFAGPNRASRAQILIPAEWLRPPTPDESARASRFLVKAIDLHASRPLPPDLYGRDFTVTLGTLSGRRVESGEGLADSFDANDDFGRRSRRVALASRDGLAVRLVPTVPGAPPGTSAKGRILRLELAEPFVYDASDGDLVLGIQNLGGVLSDLDPAGADGLDILGLPAEDAPAAARGVGALSRRYSLVVGSADAAVGLRSRFQPYLWIHTLQIPPVVTRWYLARDAEAVRWFRDPRVLEARGDAVEGRDFRIFYQSGRPVRAADGSPARDAEGTVVCEETGNFSAEPPIDGAPAIRLRIEFDPSLLERAAAGGTPGVQSLPALEYIPVGYRDA